MKDKVITLDNGLEFSALDQIIIDNKAYVFAVEVDKQKQEVLNSFIVLNVRQEGNELVFSDLSDPDEIEKIVNIFIERLKAN